MGKKTAEEFFAEIAKILRKRKYNVWTMEAAGDRIRFFDRDGKSLCSCAALNEDGTADDPAYKEF